MADTDGTTTKTNRAAFWQEHLRAWSQSGLTQADYCRQHDLSRWSQSAFVLAMDLGPTQPMRWRYRDSHHLGEPRVLRLV